MLRLGKEKGLELLDKSDLAVLNHLLVQPWIAHYLYVAGGTRTIPQWRSTSGGGGGGEEWGFLFVFVALDGGLLVIIQERVIVSEEGISVKMGWRNSHECVLGGENG